jgi:probable LLM family oxidoreductase
MGNSSSDSAVRPAAPSFEFGLDSFGEHAIDERGHRESDAEAVRRIVNDAVLAESVGVDIFSIGEHYRSEHMDSAGHVILGVIAGRTERIRLGTSVTVLSTRDPVRLFAEFATLDAASNGRAQLVLGRASSVESFPLFGFDLADYETLFEEKLELFTRLLRDQPVTWSGSSRASLRDQFVYPAIAPGAIPTWIGVGGSPQSVVRAARYGLPLMLAIIGGHPTRFVPYVDLYERALEQFGHPLLPIGMHSLGMVADTDEEARAAHWPLYESVMRIRGGERGFPPPTRKRYEMDIAEGALFVGSPDTVAAKIAAAARDLHLSRFDLKYNATDAPFAAQRRSIELLGREVIPRVRELLAEHPARPAEVNA